MTDYLDPKYRKAIEEDPHNAPLEIKRAGDRSIYKEPSKAVVGVEDQGTIKNQKGDRQALLSQGYFRKPVDPESLSTPIGKERMGAARPWKPRRKD